MKTYLLIQRMGIQNANAMSSPYTIGFPAMTAWLGAVHALQRSVQQNGFEAVAMAKTAVSCHGFHLHSKATPAYCCDVFQCVKCEAHQTG